MKKPRLNKRQKRQLRALKDGNLNNPSELLAQIIAELESNFPKADRETLLRVAVVEEDYINRTTEEEYLHIEDITNEQHLEYEHTEREIG